MATAKGKGTTRPGAAAKPRPARKKAAPKGADKLGPVLRRQLARADVRVEAVVQLRGPDAAGGFVPPERIESLARTTLRAVERATGRKAGAWHVFRHLSSFVVSGPSELIRGFAQLDVVRAVIANRQPALAPIAPVRSRPARRPAARPRAGATPRRKRS